MTVIVDYGVGNLYSLRCSLAHLGIESCVCGDASKIITAERIILPGVGAFGDAMRRLRALGLAEVLRRAAGAGKPLLGICLGMQLLLCESEEFGIHTGLGLIEGRAASLAAALAAAGQGQLKVPHMGYNPVDILQEGCPLLKNTKQGESFYYVHSYCAAGCEAHTAAASGYGVRVPGVLHSGNVYGVQFHPEKSGHSGLKLLRAFAEVKAC